LLEVRLLDGDDCSYAAKIDDLRHLLGAPNNPTLFPGHFLKATFPKMGGRVALLHAAGELTGVGFLFPRTLRRGRREFTLRLHRTHAAFNTPADDVAAAVQTAIGAKVCSYEPTSPVAFSPLATAETGLAIGRPTAEDAETIRKLQERIWHPNSLDALYPADLHSLEFRPGSSLIAKVDTIPVGFLFGFYKFGGTALPPPLAARYPSDFCLESQLMGVLPEYRGRHVSVALKRKQAELARAEGIQIVNWTFDPLQYANAHLNFARLGAIAFNFYPNYYDFVNELNVAPASRLMVTWLIDSVRVRSDLTGPGLTEVDLLSASHVIQLNRGPDLVAMPHGARRIAIEIPESWTRLQRDASQPDLAMRWRRTTDEILGEWLGIAEGKYVLTGTGRDNARHYLIGERVDEHLLQGLVPS
jgi:predicted GNAT superfamily acetyltransferase